MPPSCDKRWKFSAAHFQISDLTGALVRGDTEHNETKRQHVKKLSWKVESWKDNISKNWAKIAKSIISCFCSKAYEKCHTLAIQQHVGKQFYIMERENQSCVAFSFSNFSSFLSFSSFSNVSSSSYFCQTKGEGIAREAIGRGEERLLRPYFAFIATFVGTFTRYKNPAGFIAIF